MFFSKNKNTKKSARELDKIRIEKKNAKKKKEKEKKVKNQIPRTTIKTMPYERFISEYVMLVKSNVRIGKQTANLYSKSYLVPDINYSSLPSTEQEIKLLSYIDLLNGFDSAASVQVSMCNTKINKKDFENRILLQYKEIFKEETDEFNKILHDKLMLGQNGIQCKKYITVTVAAVNYETANTRFLNYETHLNLCVQKLGTEIIPMKANERVRILCDIFRGVNTDLSFITRDEFARQSEKMLCCPNYFEFKKDYLMWGDKYARCLYIQKLPNSLPDTVFKDFLETNQTMIITKNVEFVEPSAAIELIRRQLTNINVLYYKGYLKDTTNITHAITLFVTLSA